MPYDCHEGVDFSLRRRAPGVFVSGVGSPLLLSR